MAHSCWLDIGLRGGRPGERIAGAFWHRMLLHVRWQDRVTQQGVTYRGGPRLSYPLGNMATPGEPSAPVQSDKP